MQPPLSVQLLPPHQPLYATSSRNMSYVVLLRNVAYVDSYININCASPPHSTQVLTRQQVIEFGRLSYRGELTLNFTTVSDNGKYTCFATLSSTNPYVVTSDPAQGSAVVNVRGELRHMQN